MGVEYRNLQIFSNLVLFLVSFIIILWVYLLSIRREFNPFCTARSTQFSEVKKFKKLITDKVSGV